MKINKDDFDDYMFNVIIQDIEDEEREENKKNAYYRDEFGKVKIDFMIEKDACIVPIEVKSEINLRAKSFNNFIKKYNIKKAIRYSLADYKENDIIIDNPLYAI